MNTLLADPAIRAALLLVGVVIALCLLVIALAVRDDRRQREELDALRLDAAAHARRARLRVLQGQFGTRKIS